MVAALVLALVPLAVPALPTPTPKAQSTTACNSAPPTTQLLDPPEIRSQNGVLDVTLQLNGSNNPLIFQGDCWWHADPSGSLPSWVPPTLRLRQGDELRLTLVNQLLRVPGADDPALEISRSQPEAMDDMSGSSTGSKPIGGSSTGSKPIGGSSTGSKPIGGSSTGSKPMSGPHMSGMRGMSNNAGGQRDENYKLMCGQQQLFPTPTPDPVTGRIYGYHRSPWNETNLHFHGLNVSPKEPSDDVVQVMLCPRKTLSDTPRSYTYVLDIPADEPPGTYWYHPHAHGESERQVLSQLTGVIIIDPIVPGIPQKLPNRVVIVRDVGETGGASPDTELNSGWKRQIRATAPNLKQIRDWYDRGMGPINYGPPPYRFGPPQSCPASLGPDKVHGSGKGLRVNFVPLPMAPNNLKQLPETTMTLGSTQYWRFANTAADTILDVEMFVNGVKTPIPVASRDGVPLTTVNGFPTYQPIMMDHVRLPPAARMEFYMHASQRGNIVMRTRTIDTGCLGDVDLERDLLIVHVQRSKAQTVPTPISGPPRAVKLVPTRFADLARQRPVRHRYFVFTEYNRDDEPLPDFYITELSNLNAVEHPYAMHGPPDVVVKNGTVEEWTILNYTQELHEFHIHQIHFFVERGQGIPYGEHQLLDTVEVPYGTFVGSSSKTFVPGGVTLRMDFRDPHIIGEFVYHCHILSHEDNGMMARIKVVR